MGIAERIQTIVEDEGISYRKFETSIGKSNGYVNQVLKNKGSSPTVDVVLTIIDKYPKYNLLWLVSGQGNKLNDHVREDLEEEKPQSKSEAVEDIIAEKVFEKLGPLLNGNTDVLKKAILNLHIELKEIKNAQAKTQETVEVIEKNLE